MPPSLPRRLRLGPLALALWHRPLGVLRESLRQGGPWQQQRTRRGQREMEAAARRLTPHPRRIGEPLVVHLLTGKNFWYQTAFCLQSFARHTDRPVHPVLYDDGTLTTEFQEPLSRLFPAARFVTQRATLSRLDALLPRERFPVLRERWDHYPNLRKLTDPHLGTPGWKLVLDSDLLFFRSPDFLLDWLDAPTRPLHAIDVERSYGYSDALLARVAGGPLAGKLNVGLCGLNGDELDWDQLEELCRTLIAAERTHYFLEQALVAVLLAERACAVAPAADYVTLPPPAEARRCSAVMHHYVAGSKRWYFQHNWRRFT